MKNNVIETFTNADGGMTAFVTKNLGGEGYNVSLRDDDAGEFVPAGFVGIKDLSAAVAKAKHIAGVR